MKQKDASRKCNKRIVIFINNEGWKSLLNIILSEAKNLIKRFLALRSLE